MSKREPWNNENDSIYALIAGEFYLDACLGCKFQRHLDVDPQIQQRHCFTCHRDICYYCSSKHDGKRFCLFCMTRGKF
jgi:hypothetical protein